MLAPGSEPCHRAGLPDRVGLQGEQGREAERLTPDADFGYALVL
jgi:hypothetical protein